MFAFQKVERFLVGERKVAVAVIKTSGAFSVAPDNSRIGRNPRISAALNSDHHDAWSLGQTRSFLSAGLEQITQTNDIDALKSHSVL